MTPSVNITKQDGNTGAVKPSGQGVLAIIAASAIGVALQPATFARPTDALAANGLGPLVEYASYYMNTAKKPVLLIKPNTTTSGAFGVIAKVMVGTSIPTTSGTPVDNYYPVVTFVAGGTIGVAGITYTVSLDGGATTGPVTALGTATSIGPILAPNVNLSTGITFNLAAGTIVAGDTFSVVCARPQMTNTDLIAALEALRVTKAPWDGVLIDADLTATMVATVDSWLSALEATGVFKMAWMNTRHKLRPAPATESEATYATAMGTLLASTSTIRVDVGTDAGDLPSSITGLVHPRPASLAIATRSNPAPLGQDPAWEQLGPVPGFQISDTNGNPKWHDEALYPGLDGLRLSAFRSVNDSQGAYINNANLLSPNGSDYVYDQHARTMNAACRVSFGLLQKSLSRGVKKQAADPITGKIFMLETEASGIEATVNPAISTALKDQVTGAAFILSRSDDLSANSGATVNSEVQIASLAYIKNFNVVSKFVKQVSVKIS